MSDESAPAPAEEIELARQLILRLPPDMIGRMVNGEDSDSPGGSFTQNTTLNALECAVEILSTLRARSSK